MCRPILCILIESLTKKYLSLLHVVACCCAKFETDQTFQPTTPNISFFFPWFPKCSATMLDPFAQLFQYFKSRLSLIVRVNVVLNRTVVVDRAWRFDNLCGSHLQSQSELYHVSWWYYTLVIDLIGQLLRDVIGRLSVKPWCYRLWRLVISNWCVSIRLLSQL